MTTARTSTDRYLEDLARMLAELEPEHRDEVLAGVREHLEATLAEHPDDPTAIDAALLRLGPPERVAAEARTGATSTTGPSPRWDPGSIAWAKVGVLATGVGLLPFLAARGLALLLGRLTNGTSPLADGIAFELSRVSGGMTVATPIWLVGLVAVAVSPRFTRRTRRRLIVCGPVVVATDALAGGLVGWTYDGSIVALVLLWSVVAYVIVACRRGWTESTRWTTGTALRTPHPAPVRIAAAISLTTVALPVAIALLRLVPDLAGPTGVGWPASISLLPHPVETLVLLALVFPVWILATVVAVVGNQPATRTKGALALLGPGMALSVIVAAPLQGSTAVSTALSLVLLTAVLVGVALVARRVWEETSRP